MKNLFVINTPYHLLTCFILTHSIFKQDDNYLALMHPHGYDKWQSSLLMSYISSIQCGYKNIFPLLQWLSSKNKTQSYKQQAQYVKDNITPLNIDNVFIAVDISPVNQLLVMAVGQNHFYRFIIHPFCRHRIGTGYGYCYRNLQQRRRCGKYGRLPECSRILPAGNGNGGRMR